MVSVPSVPGLVRKDAVEGSILDAHSFFGVSHRDGEVLPGKTAIDAMPDVW